MKNVSLWYILVFSILLFDDHTGKTYLSTRLLNINIKALQRKGQYTTKECHFTATDMSHFESSSMPRTAALSRSQ